MQDANATNEANAIDDRGDDLLAPDPIRPEDDKAALDAAAEAAKGDEADESDGKSDGSADKPEGSEDDKPKSGKKSANERIQELIRRNKDREADLQRQISELQKATSISKTNENLEQAESQLAELEDKYSQFLLDGQAKEAAAVRTQMRQLERAISVAEARFEAASAKDAVKAELAYDAAVSALEEKYPELNPDAEEFDGELAQEVLELHGALVAKGLAPALSIQKSVKYVFAERGILGNSADDDRGNELGSNKANGIKRTLDAKNRNAAASRSQPPNAAKVGADSDALGGGLDESSVLKMNQEDFAKLSDEALAKMRGDFVG
jgi:hypothetical protein